MIEHGTVIGNVTRTHRPCGACGELVETCPHAGRGGRDRRPLTARERDEANLARAERRRRQAADVAAFMRPYRSRP